jgi:nucleoside-diphosphate-sugar epimerase
MAGVQDRVVMVTGAGGNLGSKLVDFLLKAPWCSRIVAVDRDRTVLDRRYGGCAGVEALTIDLARADLAALSASVANVDAIIHFAVLNPLPDSSWAEAAHSFDMTAMLLMAARDSGVRRFVFASSNHTVGHYMMTDLSGGVAPGSLTTGIFAPGSKWQTEAGEIIGYAYGAGKIFGERLCLAAAVKGGLSTVAIRIGWCQAGENRAATLDASGNPKLGERGLKSRSGDSELRWFRNMWLSDRDFCHLFERSILSSSADWPHPGIVINGVSANAGMGWEIRSARDTIGYVPLSNVWDEV